MDRLRKIIQLLDRWRNIAAVVLALFSLGLIFWVASAIWQQPCREASAGLASRSECLPLLADLTPLIVALGFWIVGLVLWLSSQQSPAVGFLLVANLLAAGKLAALGSDASGRLFYLLLAWLSPLSFHFHLVLLGQVRGRIKRILLGSLYGLAAVWSLPFLLWALTTLQQSGWFAVLRPGVRLTGAVTAVSVIFLLFWEYRHHSSPVVRRRIRLIFFGGVLANTPLLLLSELPDTLGATVFIPYHFTFPWLLLVPLTYGYSLLRHRLARAEVALNRAAVYYLLVTLLLSVYLVAAAALNRFIAAPTDHWPLTSALLSVGLLLLFVPLQRGLRRLTNWVWYGGEVSYVNIVGRLAQSLSLTLDRGALRRLLMDDLASAMRLSSSALLLKEQDGDLALVDAKGFEPGIGNGYRLPGDGRLITHLEALAAPVAGDRVHRALAEAPLGSEERALLARAGVAFWLPMVSGGGLQGLMLIGPRPGGDFFTAEDRRILATLTQQAGVAAHNVRLMEQVRAGREELARAHRQLLVGHEQERRRLAHELHDGAVQQLLGITYQLAQSYGGDGAEATPIGREMRREVLGVVAQLRRVIGALRPAGLDELGLTIALEGHIARLKREEMAELPHIELDLDNSGTALPASVTITLFRVAQEALRNALKHAQAHHVRLRLRLLADEVVLSVWDDGCGFLVPARLSELAQADHYGLLGMAERVSWVGGRINIRSRPGMGTEVTACVPLKEVRSQDDRDGVDGHAGYSRAVGR